jgi:hypothetical protein
MCFIFKEFSVYEHCWNIRNSVSESFARATRKDNESEHIGNDVFALWEWMVEVEPLC